MRPYVATEPLDPECSGCPPLVLDQTLNGAMLVVLNSSSDGFRPNLELGYPSSPSRTIQLKPVGANTSLTQTFALDDLRGQPSSSGGVGPLPDTASLAWMAGGQPLTSHLVIELLPQ